MVLDAAAIEVDAGGRFVDRRYGDAYASRDGAAAQARAVFLAGCDLPRRWAGRRCFRVLELGFGLGHNFRATLETWREDPRRPARLDYIGVEGHLVTPEWIRRAHADCAFGTALTAQWPPRHAGIHLLRFAGGAVRLLLVQMEAAAALAAVDCRADAVYLDGFAPARNPAMWSRQLFARLRGRVAGDARIATYSVAAVVRAHLAATGFEWRLAPGFGHKRARLEAWPRSAHDGPAPAEPARVQRVAIVGAGVAGLAAAEALAAEGIAPTLYDPAPMTGASAIPAALIHPPTAPAADLDLALREHALRAARAALPAAVRHDLPMRGPRADPGGRASPRSDPAAGPADGTEGAADASATWVDTAAWAAWILPRHRLRRRAVRALVPDADRWIVRDADGDEDFDAIVLAHGAAAAPALITADGGHQTLACALTPVRGQVEVARLDRVHGLREALTGAGYAIPVDAHTLVLGASFEPGVDAARIRAADRERTLARLRREFGLVVDVACAAIRSHAGVRAVTRDRRPLVGALADPLSRAHQRDGYPQAAPGLYASLGHGSRGYLTAFLAAEVLAAQLAGRTVALPRALQAAIDPRRAARR